MSNVLETDVEEHREPAFKIQPTIYERWSPRAMSGEALCKVDLMRLFEAARWAPSSYNGQPWRFVYARRNTPQWDDFSELLGDFNREWTRSAAVLVVLVSRKTFEHNDKPARTHSFDCGAAWQNLALQAQSMNLVVHAMEGFDYEAARDLLEMSDTYQVEVMIAIGLPAPKDVLDEDLQERETPSDRKPVYEIAFEGRLPRD